MLESKTGLKFARLSIYWVSFLLLGLNAISPAMSTIAEAMPGRSPVEIQMLEQLPYLLTIPTLLTAGMLSKKISRKLLMIIGMSCYLVGGCVCIFAAEYHVILVCRCLLGIGIGILNPCTDGLIADFFYDSKDYPKMIGLNYAFKSAGGVFYSLCAGHLATISWHAVFFVYLIGFPVLFFLLFVIPDAPSRTEDMPLFVKVNGKRRLQLPAIVAPIMVLAFLGSLAVSTTNTNVSFLITDNGFGTAATAGIAAALFTLGNFAGSTSYSKFNQYLGTHAYLIGQVTLLSGLLVCGFSGNLTMVFIGVFLMGLGNGTMDPALMYRVGKLGVGNATLYFAVFMAAMNLGSTVQGMLIPTISMALGGTGYGALNYLVGAAVMVIAILICLVINSKLKPEHDAERMERKMQKLRLKYEIRSLEESMQACSNAWGATLAQANKKGDMYQ